MPPWVTNVGNSWPKGMYRLVNRTMAVGVNTKANPLNADNGQMKEGFDLDMRKLETTGRIALVLLDQSLGVLSVFIFTFVFPYPRFEGFRW